MKLIYEPQDKPKLSQCIVFGLQQLLAIMAATIAVPNIIGHGMSPAAALFGAGAGTLIYLLFTKFKSPVFLSSSFAFLGSMAAAFAGGVSMSLGYLGLIIGAAFSGIVYAVIAFVVKFTGTRWINKLMPPVVIGSTVAIVGLSLAPNAISDLFTGNVTHTELAEVAVNGTVQKIQSLTLNGEAVNLSSQVQNASPYLCLLCGMVTLVVTMLCSIRGKKLLKMIPFIIGICAGYGLAAILTVIGNSANLQALQIVDFSKFSELKWLPDFTFLTAFSGDYAYGELGSMGAYLAAIAVSYIPVTFVVFAEHIADHENISFIIHSDLLKDPGLHSTLLGDGVGSIVGAFFGGCPNTTYGESIGCVAITGNASVVTIMTTAIMAIAVSFLAPFSTFLSTIPSCVMGGVCMALYGFIAVSGLRMLQLVDLEEDNRNLFVASVILIAGIGGMNIKIGSVVVTEIACALIMGVIVNRILSKKKD